MESAQEPIVTEVWPPQPETDTTMQFESVSVQQRGDTLQISIPDAGLSEYLGVRMRTLLWPMTMVALGIVSRFVYSRHPVTVNSALIGAVPVPAILWVYSAIKEFRSRRWKASRRVRLLRDQGIYIDGAGVDGLLATIRCIAVVERGTRYLVVLERSQWLLSAEHLLDTRRQERRA